MRRMAPAEARLVLNVKDQITKEELEQSFERMFQANDVENGGSFYLQSKIYRARESLLEDMGLPVDEPEILKKKEQIESENEELKDEESDNKH